MNLLAYFTLPRWDRARQRFEQCDAGQRREIVRYGDGLRGAIDTAFHRIHKLIHVTSLTRMPHHDPLPHEFEL